MSRIERAHSFEYYLIKGTLLQIHVWKKLENLRGRRPSNSSTKMLVEEEDFDSDICESPQAHTEYCGHDSFMLSFSAQNTHKSPQSLGKINEAATISSSSVSSIKDNNSDSK
ncbi:unnamed protein product [Lepeophtheirus salmonis]|uniref:(salmon louse) hypothetical protein n=1 Tax=Lepeophtheirus salmonis TaxID=72036 RepID=A0A7R8CG17_LEPSM|nr:unnamed protein product [Lepeophtheirus salmonis]CAF2811546.1 unnamed protein product [Lepeophtheirus salmonis]